MLRLFLKLFVGFCGGLVMHYVLVRCPHVETNQRESRAFQELKKTKPNTANATVYIGLMSSEKFLDSRIKWALDTWLSPVHWDPDVDVEVYATPKPGSDGTVDGKLRVIQLPGVKDTMYPPMKKYYSMFMHMHNAYINNYEWFLRIDDDAYVDTKKLSRLLHNYNSSKVMQIGCPGFGIPGGDRLYLRNGETYCKTGTGIALSRGLLRLIAPHLRKCLGTLYTKHDDVELGRCIFDLTGLGCPLGWDSRCLFYQNYNRKTQHTHIAAISRVNVDQGIIFHSNKIEEYHYLFQAKILRNRIARLMQLIGRKQEEINRLSVDQSEAYRDLDIVWSSQFKGRRYDATKIKEEREWNNEFVSYYVGRHEEKRCHLPLVDKAVEVHRADLVQNYRAIRLPWSVEETSIFDVEWYFTYNKVKKRLNFRTNTFFAPPFFTENGVDLGKCADMAFLGSPSDFYGAAGAPRLNAVTVVVRYKNEANFQRFLHRMKKHALQVGETVNLVVFANNAKFVEESLAELRNSFESLRFTVMKTSPWLTDKEMLQKAGTKNDANLLLLFDTDLVVETGLLQRMRLNTIPGKQLAIVTVTKFYVDGDENLLDMKKKEILSVYEQDVRAMSWKKRKNQNILQVPSTLRVFESTELQEI